MAREKRLIQAGKFLSKAGFKSLISICLPEAVIPATVLSETVDLSADVVENWLISKESNDAFETYKEKLEGMINASLNEAASDLTEEKLDAYAVDMFYFVSQLEIPKIRMSKKRLGTFLYDQYRQYKSLDSEDEIYLNIFETFALKYLDAFWNGDITKKECREFWEGILQEFEEIHKQIAQGKQKEAVQEDITDFQNDNQQYANGFTKPLFLHVKKNKKVTLANLYTWQHYSEENKDRKDNLMDKLSSFISDEKDRLMIIEGNAGAGKSTLAQCMNYYYQNPAENKGIKFYDRQIVTVRLRDFSKDMKKAVAEKNILFNGIMKYLHVGKKDFVKSFEKTLYILDGLDELCTSDSGIDSRKLIRNLMEQLKEQGQQAKILITTRPIYGGVEKGDGLCLISLCPYDVSERKIWIEKYEKCGEKIQKYIQKFLDDIEDEDSIFNIPLNLYMLLAKSPAPDKLENTWSLYHEIFYENIRDTKSSIQTENDDGEFTEENHPDKEYWDIYYQICEEVAYEMYTSNNENLTVNSEGIQTIIQRIVNSENYEAVKLITPVLSELKDHCYALCGFWKANPGSGVFEFLHNDIRDFFLCEKVYREMNRPYVSDGEKKEWQQKDIERLAREFAERFQYGRLKPKVLAFLVQRAASRYEEKGKKDFCIIENERTFDEKLYPSVMQELVTNDRIYPDSEENVIRQMSRTVKCIWEIYSVCKSPFREEQGGYTYLWKSLKYVNRKGILKHILMEEEDDLLLPYTFWARIEMKNAYFKGADLRNSNLEYAVLCHANMEGANLSGANLEHADFSNAKLMFSRMSEVLLEHTVFEEAALYGIEPKTLKRIITADNFTWANMTGTRTRRQEGQLAAGDLYEFGAYWQEKQDADGKKPKKTPILWRVLEVDARNGRALLLADQILDCQPYHKEWKATNWEKCTLRARLNEPTFYSEEDGERSFLYEAFNEEERKRICEIDVMPDENPYAKYRATDQGKIVKKQKIFLVSGREVIKYFSGKKITEDYWFFGLGGRQAAAIETDFAKERYGNRVFVSQELGRSMWWLRSGGSSGGNAMYVNYAGSVNVIGGLVDNALVGIRPALWLDLKS